MSLNYFYLEKSTVVFWVVVMQLFSTVNQHTHRQQLEKLPCSLSSVPSGSLQRLWDVGWSSAGPLLSGTVLSLGKQYSESFLICDLHNPLLLFQCANR